MRRSSIRVAVLFLLCVWVLGPVFENVDPWDAFPDGGDNIILLLTALTALFGAVLCLALLIARCLQPAPIAAMLSASPARAPIRRFVPPHSTPRELTQPLRI